jgi:phosphotransferase system enzyme I (PtsP)
MNTEQINVLEDIFQMLSTSESPEQSLDLIVRMITDRFPLDVCSVYVYDPLENKLALKATMGLTRESVGTIEMEVNEGLTGLVIQTMKPIFVSNPARHPRFKYYEKSGEEKFQTYLGLPLIFHQKVLGAMVIQTIAEDGIAKSDIPLFTNIAGQISSVVALLGRAFDEKRKTAKLFMPEDFQVEQDFLRGESVSEQVTEGYAFYLPDDIRFDEVLPGKNKNGFEEEKRLISAFDEAILQIQGVAKKSVGLAAQDAAIIDVLVMLLGDPLLRKNIIARIHQGDCAEFALKQVVMEQVERFEAMEDPYLSERSADVLDIGRRVLGNLMGIGKESQAGFTRETIVVASDISPVKLLSMRQPNLKGIVLAKGGRTSHTVILARSLEIPIVINVDRIFDKVRHGDYLILDGASGLVYANPSMVIREEYARRKGESEKVLQKLLALKDQPAVTLDGYEVKLGANIGLLSDLALVEKYGADHIGLYRTEFPFLLRKTFPTEDEQVTLYTKVLTKAGGRSVTMRTFDVGGDKFLSYLDYPKEDNPFLGWRSIRISLDLENEFRTQIRSILRASASGKTKMLFPMITAIEEIRRVIELVNAEKDSLKKENIAFDPDIPLGIMVEVPAAVTILDRMLNYVDFVGIGTNDLIQYLLAVDRNNRKVAARYNALHPSVISTIKSVIAICRKNKKHVEICGESASAPACILLYMAMGADHLSMNASSIPVAKNLIRNTRLAQTQKVLRKILKMEDAESISRYMKTLVKGILPDQ